MLFSRGGRIGKTVGFPGVRSLSLSADLNAVKILRRGGMSGGHSVRDSKGEVGEKRSFARPEALGAEAGSKDFSVEKYF